MQNPCIVFDLDDTLYLERDYVHSGFRAVSRWAAARLGVRGFAEEAWRLFEEGVRGSIFQVAFKNMDHEADPQTIKQMVQVYRCHRPDIRLLPDATQCLARIREKATLCMITDGPLSSQRAKCDSLGLRDIFDWIVFTDEWGPQFYKPHPRSYRFVQERVRPRKCDRFVYVGDNPRKDFTAPLVLGWDTVRIRRPKGLHFCVESLPNALPNIECPDLCTLTDLMLGSGNGN